MSVQSRGILWCCDDANECKRHHKCKRDGSRYNKSAQDFVCNVTDADS